MAFYHVSLKNGKKGTAVNHCDYINREGHFSTGEKAAELRDKGTVNLPWWAASGRDFFEKAEIYERSNASTYKTLEIALPCELTYEENLKLVNKIVMEICGKDKVGVWAIHSKPAVMSNVEQIHLHLIVCERIMTDPPEKTKDYHIFFRRYNKNNLSHSGYKKDRRFCAGGGKFLKAVRSKIADLINEAYRNANIPVSVSAKSLKDQKQDAIDSGDAELTRFLDRAKPKYVPFRQFKKYQEFLRNSELLDYTELLPTMPMLAASNYDEVLKSDIEFGDFLNERTDIQLRKYKLFKERVEHNKKFLPVLIKNFNACTVEELEHILEILKDKIELREFNNNMYIRAVGRICNDKGINVVANDYASKGKLKKLSKAKNKLAKLKKKKDGLILIKRYSPDDKINAEIENQQRIVTSLEIECYELQKQSAYQERLTFAINDMRKKRETRKEKCMFLQKENAGLGQIKELLKDVISVLYDGYEIVLPQRMMNIIDDVSNTDDLTTWYDKLKMLKTEINRKVRSREKMEKIDSSTSNSIRTRSDENQLLR